MSNETYKADIASHSHARSMPLPQYVKNVRAFWGDRWRTRMGEVIRMRHTYF